MHLKTRLVFQMMEFNFFTLPLKVIGNYPAEYLLNYSEALYFSKITTVLSLVIEKGEGDNFCTS